MQTPKISKLAIICQHPVQYYAPLFQLMAQQQDIKVFYAPKATGNKFDEGFGHTINWDIPVLQGYEHLFSHRLKDINDYCPTAILIYGWAYTSHMKIILHFSKRITVLFRGDSTILDPISPWRSILKSYLLRKVYTRIDFALYVGSNNKAYFEHYGLKSKQLIYARHAVDNTRFAANRQLEAVKLRTSLGIANTEVLVLFAGKLIPKKRPEMLLKAFGSLTPPGAHLLFVGNGILEDTLKKNALALPNQACIHFLSFQNQQRMPVIYQSCDLFCMPSTGPGESWGLAINEAMAAGKAILSSDKVGGAADLIDDNNGRIFTSGDLRDLTNKLQIMLASKRTLEHMGQASSERIKYWNFQHQIDAIYGIS